MLEPIEQCLTPPMSSFAVLRVQSCARNTPLPTVDAQSRVELQMKETLRQTRHYLIGALLYRRPIFKKNIPLLAYLHRSRQRMMVLAVTSVVTQHQSLSLALLPLSLVCQDNSAATLASIHPGMTRLRNLAPTHSLHRLAACLSLATP